MLNHAIVRAARVAVALKYSQRPEVAVIVEVASVLLPLVLDTARTLATALAMAYQPSLAREFVVRFYSPTSLWELVALLWCLTQ